MSQTHTVTAPCVCKPAVAGPVSAPAPKFSAELMRMLSQLVMLR